MKYVNKKTRKIKKKMVEFKAREDLDDDQLERLERLMRRHGTLLSRGGKYERSHKKRVGNIVNRNIDKRYNTASKTIERIEGKKTDKG